MAERTIILPAYCANDYYRWLQMLSSPHSSTERSKDRWMCVLSSIKPGNEKWRFLKTHCTQSYVAHWELPSSQPHIQFSQSSRSSCLGLGVLLSGRVYSMHGGLSYLLHIPQPRRIFVFTIFTWIQVLCRNSKCFSPLSYLPRPINES